MKLIELISCRMRLVWALVNTVMNTSFQKELECHSGQSDSCLSKKDFRPWYAT